MVCKPYVQYIVKHRGFKHLPYKPYVQLQTLYARIRQNTLEYARFRQNTAEYARIRKNTPEYRDPSNDPLWDPVWVPGRLGAKK